MRFLIGFGLFHLVFQNGHLYCPPIFFLLHSSIAHDHVFFRISSLIFLVGYPFVIQNQRMVTTSYCSMPYLPAQFVPRWWAFVHILPLYFWVVVIVPPFILGITHKLRRLGHVKIIGSFLARVSNSYTFI
jgi:hypothetical protein